MNVEPNAPWSLQPGSERNAVGAALRQALDARSGTLPHELDRLLDQLRPLPELKEDRMPRELIDTGTDKRFVRRDEEGRFKESDDVGRSLAQDQKRDAKTKPKKGEGDKGDR